jgi:hypothetical protein
VLEPVPNLCEQVADGITDGRGDDDDRDLRSAHHMRPEAEADESLRPPERDERRPYQMQAAYEPSDGESGLFWIEMIHIYVYAVMANALMIHLINTIVFLGLWNVYT